MNAAKALSTILSWKLVAFSTLGVGQRAPEENVHGQTATDEW